MNNQFQLTDKIGDIVAMFPEASNIFMDHRVDFCCGGDRPLEEAIREKNIDGNAILEKLNEKYKEFQERNEEFKDWAKETPTKLIRYIVDKHHTYLNNELPRIGELILTILRVHGVSHPELFQVHQLFNALKTELEAHLIKEEQIIFPAIRTYEKEKNPDDREKVLSLIAELEDEHTAAGDIIKEVQEITSFYAPPKDACTTYNLTYEKLKELEADTFEHIHLENNILFKNL